ncbi:MAG: biopolymer transporter ExbD [Elusimicrobia bacterium]|nr:biopolymer transporter ExbD [Elusimicrobiota bacterium]
MEQKIDIDLIPLTSMALIILLILMIISPNISRSSIEVKLPEAETAQDKRTDKIIVTVANDGRIDVGGSEIDFEELMPLLKKKLSRNPEATLLIRADKSIYYSDIELILKAGRSCGAKKVAIGTEKN